MSPTIGWIGRSGRYLALLLLLLSALSLFGCSWWTAPPKPRLVVLLVIDQFRADYLERFEDRFGEDGFKRLLREGAVFTSAYYPYAATETGPGHATLATGTTPNIHGIVGNSLVDVETGQFVLAGQVVPAVQDLNSPVHGGTEISTPASPFRLLVPTLGDRFAESSGGSAQVFGVALKNRSANFAAGRNARAAYWFDGQTGKMSSSAYFMEALPGWVDEFNRTRGANRFYGKAWTEDGTVYSPLTSASGAPDREFYVQVTQSPHGNTLVLDFVRELIHNEGLGDDDVTDFLAIGFSANDLVGHRWGPYSDAVASMVEHTDGQVAELLSLLDEVAGEGNWVLAFSADHGVAPSVEQAQARGLPGKGFASQDVRNAAEKALSARWGAGPWLLEQGYRTKFVFDRAVLERHKVQVEEAVRVAGEAATAVAGIRGYYSGSSHNLPSELVERFDLNHYPGRSADVVLLPEEYAIRDPGADTGQHGSPYDYDRHVPLVFFGMGVRPGVYDVPVSTIDLAPTLAKTAGVAPLPEATGKVLEQVFTGKSSE